MLEKIQELKDSLTSEQEEEAQKILGSLYSDFVELINASTLEEAQDVLDDFRIRLRRAPLKAVRLFGTLTEDQKELVRNFLKEEESEEISEEKED